VSNLIGIDCCRRISSVLVDPWIMLREKGTAKPADTRSIDKDSRIRMALGERIIAKPPPSLSQCLFFGDFYFSAKERSFFFKKKKKTKDSGVKGGTFSKISTE
jgi:hypothetical protein